MVHDVKTLYHTVIPLALNNLNNNFDILSSQSLETVPYSKYCDTGKNYGSWPLQLEELAQSKVQQKVSRL